MPLELWDPSGGGGGANEFDPPGNDKVPVTGGVGGSIARCDVDCRGRFAGLRTRLHKRLILREQVLYWGLQLGEISLSSPSKLSFS